MNKDKLKDFIDFARITDLQEVIWEKKGISIRFRLMGDAADSSASENSTPPPVTQGEPAQSPEKMVIKSTMVGTFYRGDSKDRPPLVIEGTIVTAGQPVGSVEAMKIMKDVNSPIDCKIVRSLVENGHAVEYGQPLFEVEPSAQEPNV